MEMLKALLTMQSSADLNILVQRVTVFGMTISISRQMLTQHGLGFRGVLIPEISVAQISLMLALTARKMANSIFYRPSKA